MAAMEPALPTAADALVADARSRASLRPTGRERRTALCDGLLFLAAATAFAVAAPWDRSLSAPVLAAFIAALALASRVEFEVAEGSAVPTQLVFVPMLLLLPAPIVPLAVAAAVVLGSAPDYVRGRVHPERAVGQAAMAWFALAPALLLVLAGQPSPALGHAPLYALLLAAQLVFETAYVLLRERLGLRISPRVLLRPLLFVAAIDGLLAPTGLLIALACADAPLTILLVLPLLVLLVTFARERSARIDHQLALHDARASNEQLGELARTDALTQVPNRRAWNEDLPGLLQRAREEGTPVCVALVDLDHFKRYNDTHGHPRGDRLLEQAAGAWSRQLRAGDLLARYGGEEFALALPSCELEDAARLGERLRAAVPDGQTCSIGLAQWSGSECADELVARADAALYRAKASGRDRLVRAPRPASARRLAVAF